MVREEKARDWLKASPKSRFKEWVRPEIKHNIPTRWNWVVAYPENLVLGEHTDIGIWSYINARYGVIIENKVQIGGGSLIYSHNTINNTKGLIHIKKKALIGAHSILLPGVIIEEEELIPAKSLVYYRDGKRFVK